MSQECVAHICTKCGSAYKTRDKAKRHVMAHHEYGHKRGPGQFVRYLWMDLSAASGEVEQ